jgi:hypothetical protein
MDRGEQRLVLVLAVLLAACGAFMSGADAWSASSTSSLRGVGRGSRGRSGMRMQAQSDGADHFDYLVVGGGSGGIASARRAATYGAKVAVVEKNKGKLGGTCVNVGCVPKKVMFNAASVSEMLHEAKHFGFTVGHTEFDWGAITEARDAYVTRLNGIYANNLKNSGVTSIEGEAKLVGANAVEVEGTRYTADHILLAPGGRPSMPTFPGSEHTISSDGFFALKEQPKKVRGCLARVRCGSHSLTRAY